MSCRFPLCFCVYFGDMSQTFIVFILHWYCSSPGVPPYFMMVCVALGKVHCSRFPTTLRAPCLPTLNRRLGTRQPHGRETKADVSHCKPLGLPNRRSTAPALGFNKHPDLE